ncbi:ankyrin repeat protein, partial [Trichoderma virens Gv29-8]
NDIVLLSRDDVSDYNEANILPQSPETLSKIKQWLSPTDYAAVNGENYKHLNSHVAGTGSWLYSTNLYKQWHGSEVEGLLWLKGIPGSGKSVFAATSIQRLQQEEVPVLYFFFRQIIRANYEPTALLRDWLVQILPYSPPLQARLKEYLDERRTIETLSITEMFQDLRLACTYLPKVYCVIDALDEMNLGNDQFLHELAKFASWRPLKIKIIITSRPVPAVEMPLRLYPTLQVRLQQQLVDHDIAVYVQSLLTESDIPEQYQNKIKEAITEKANGIFLYAKLVMEQIMEPNANIQHILEALPANLNTMYANLLKEHSQRSGIPPHVQLLVLQWVTHANRPLRLLEMSEMLTVTRQLDGVSELKEAKDIVRAICGSLLEILPDETVSVVHHSLTEFLKGSTRSLTQGKPANEYDLLESGPTHARLALACLSYLNSGCLDSYEVDKSKLHQNFWKTRKLDQNLRLEHPFAEYATFNWHIHISKAGLMAANQPELSKLLDDFLKGNRFLVWLTLEWPNHHIEGISPLHVAAYFGLTNYMQELLKRANTNVNVVNENDESPIYWAAYNGHDNAIKLLLEYGAESNKYSDSGLTPLHEAAKRNHAAAAQVLLASGVDPLTPRTDPQAKRGGYAARRSTGRTPVQYACKNGHDEVVAIYLPFLKDINTVYQALHLAAESGQAKVVECILKHPGIDADSFVSNHTALYYACMSVDPRTIQVLLKAGANPNVLVEPSFYQRLSEIHGAKDLDPNQPGSKRMITALHVLCTSIGQNSRPSMDNLRQCFELVQEAGVGLEQRDCEGKTALHSLFSSNSGVASEEVFVLLRLLLSAGADANTTSNNGDTPLHGNPTSKDAIRLLIEEGGADINKRRSSDGKTPLLCLLASQSPEMSLEFLSFGPDCNAVDNDGNGALHVALGYWNTNRELIVALLALGADPNVKNHKGQTALHIEGVQESLIGPLVESGADLEARDSNGHTPLFQRVSAHFHIGNPNTTKVLQTSVELGAKTDCRDNKGRTLLHEAVRCDAYDRLKYFLDLGISPHVQDEAGNTLWHEAILTRSYPAQQITSHLNKPVPDMYDLLADIGVNPDEPNNQGRTPLHIASSIDVQKSMSPYAKLPMDYLLSICKNMNPVDGDGITPLHFAATISEYHVAALLRAGANAAAVTPDGLTPLHLAARACQSNIVNMLLKDFERERSSKGSTTSALVDYLDNSGRTALHYACRSGRPEVVASLLASGANTNIRSKDGRTPLQECTKFESEQELWRGCGSSGDRHHRLRAAGLKLDYHEADAPLRWTDLEAHNEKQISPERISSRVDEILDMLISHGLDVQTINDFGQNQLQEAISLIQSPSMGYTIRCFLDLADKLDPDLYKSDIEYLSRLHEQAKTIAASQEPAPTCTIHPHCREPELDMFLKSREYNRIEDLHREGADFTQPSQTNGTQWHSLVRGGYERLLEKLCTHEVVEKFEDAKWCKSWQNAAPRGPFGRRIIGPLLIAACSSSTPNMEVVKVLVETLKADVNAQVYTQIWNEGNDVIQKGESALHVLAKCHHWWQVHQALPYLISHGANINLKDDAGRTPLHIALETKWRNTPIITSFQEEAARILVSAGADIHASDNTGMSCQTMAATSSNPRMMQIILPPGTTLDISALFIAIEECNDQMFERLVSLNIDLNQRCDIKFSSEHNPATQADVPNRGFGLFSTNTTNSAKPDDKSKYIRMMQLLLSHGVDIYARFNKAVRDTKTPLVAMASTNEVINDSEKGSVGKRPPQGYHYEECTVIHELLEKSKFIQDMVDWESLDLEHRDDKGRTLLLAACRNKLLTDNMVTTKLIEQGADLSARDNDGKNVLHHIFESHAPPEVCRRNELVKLMLSKRPELIHEEDSKGNLPINCVRPGFCSSPAWHFRGEPCKDIVDILLDAGSDPLHPDANGNLPIHFLGHRPKHALFQRFLDMGIPIDIRNTKNGNTPLFIGLQGFGLQSSALQISGLQSSNIEQLAFYEDAGADFMVRNSAGETLLHTLASSSFLGGYYGGRTKDNIIIARFKFLVAKGLDPLTEDGRQRTALDVAVACDNNGLLDFFKK